MTTRTSNDLISAAATTILSSTTEEQVKAAEVQWSSYALTELHLFRLTPSEYHDTLRHTKRYASERLAVLGGERRGCRGSLT